MYVIDLNKQDLKLEQIGGKALNLAKMSRAGFNIPSGFVVTVEAYDTFIKHELEDKISEILDSVDFNREDSISRGCSLIRSLIKSENLPPHLYSPLRDEIYNLPEGYYAVRSSAVSEDLEDASFAGQLDSFLNIKKENILARIIDCWASYWNDRAVKYRHDSSIGHQDTGIAVLIQQMVDADISGVTFTANPVDGTNNVVIESTWGLGEAIASGLVTPDTFVLDREGVLLEEEIKNKAQGYFLKNGENTLLAIEDQYQERSSLNPELLQELLQLGIRLEEFFGAPQDVEWALECDKEICILQSRPVTTLTEKDDILWTRAYGDEYWADATTPLFYDVMGKMLTDYVNHEGARIMGYTDITDTKLLKLHKSRVYFNSWVLEKAFSYYPKFARSKELLNYFPLEDQERISQYPSILHKTLLSQVYIALRDSDGMMHKTDQAYRKWANRFMIRCEEFDHTNLEKLDSEELVSLYR